MKSEPRPLIFDIGRPAERAVSAACKVGSIKERTPLLTPKLRLPYRELQALAVL
jgi:hypothetical protein